MMLLLACFLAAIPAGLHPVTQARAEARARRVAGYAEAAGLTADAKWCRRIWRESSYWNHRVSRAGALGLGGILPRTGRRMCADLRWRSKPADNLACSRRVWAWAHRYPCGTGERRYRGAC